jgi:hypothetical protein
MVHYLYGGEVKLTTNVQSFERSYTLIMGNAYYGKNWRKTPVVEGKRSSFLSCPMCGWCKEELKAV